MPIAAHCSLSMYPVYCKLLFCQVLPGGCTVLYLVISENGLCCTHFLVFILFLGSSRWLSRISLAAHISKFSFLWQWAFYLPGGCRRGYSIKCALPQTFLSCFSCYVLPGDGRLDYSIKCLLPHTFLIVFLVRFYQEGCRRGYLMSLPHTFLKCFIFSFFQVVVEVVISQNAYCRTHFLLFLLCSSRGLRWL